MLVQPMTPNVVFRERLPFLPVYQSLLSMMIYEHRPRRSSSSHSRQFATISAISRFRIGLSELREADKSCGQAVLSAVTLLDGFHLFSRIYHLLRNPPDPVSLFSHTTSLPVRKDCKRSARPVEHVMEVASEEGEEIFQTPDPACLSATVLC